jgi:hypothetical protein
MKDDNPISQDWQEIADRVAQRVFRTDLSGPGFALLDLRRDWDPREFRSVLVGLCEKLSLAYQRDFGRQLRFVSLGRFDQQVTTEAHLDGGPDESLLVLGYEPTEVSSRLFLVDYVRGACDRDMTPREFLDRHNPMYRAGRQTLEEYTTEVEGLNPAHYQVLFINNSSVPYEQRRRGMLGVLHKAVILKPDPARPRNVNSILLGTAEIGQPPRIAVEAVQAFIDTAATAAA